MSLPWLSNWRSLLRVSALGVGVCGGLGAACNSSATADGASPALGMAGAGSSDGGDGGSADLDPSGISFTGPQQLNLNPKQTRELTVQTEPPSSFLVRFALPSSSGDEDPGDAVLDRSEAPTDANGVAHVVLTAPSTPANFSVRASVGQQLGVIRVSVRTLGYTTLTVIPSYSGARQVELWTATATSALGATCGSVGSSTTPDDTFSGSAGPSGELNIDRVPVGVDLIVTLRAGHYIEGCAALPALSEGFGNTVLVYASNRPINLEATQLNLEFGPSDSRPAFDELLAASTSLVESSLLGTATSDVEALLDEMQDATPGVDRASFIDAREQGDWDAALGAAFGQSAARRLRDPAKRWLAAGLTAFTAPDTFTGTLEDARKQALFTLSSVAGLDPSTAGFASSFPATWAADSSDTLLLGTQLSWVPSRLVSALAAAPARLEFTSATSVEQALALSVDCGLVSNVLIVHGAAAGSSVYEGCDASCAALACETAISNAWKRASGVSGKSVASLIVTATGSATVGDEAEIVSLDGTWVGELVDGESNALASGTLTAKSDP